jgi:hypothetical protein
MAEPREALATRVDVTEDALCMELTDGRSIAAPLAWYPRLAHATPKERRSWRLIGGVRGVHWPAIDEDISVANLLAGQPSMESRHAGAGADAAGASEAPRRPRSGILGKMSRLGVN